MVDYTNELKKLRDMHESFDLKYGHRTNSKATDEEIRDAERIKQELVVVWQRAIQTDCIDSEVELVDIEHILERLSSRRNYNF